MNKNLIPPILIILAIGIFFTFTRGYINDIQGVEATNKAYLQAINNSVDLIKTRDAVLKDYNSLSTNDTDRLAKILPDNIDNVRLIIDITNIGTRHGIVLQGVGTSAGNSAGLATQGTGNTPAAGATANSTPTYGIVTVSFSFSASYDNGISLLEDIQSSLRILDISHLSVTANASGGPDNFSVQLQTYWLKQ